MAMYSMFSVHVNDDVQQPNAVAYVIVYINLQLPYRLR